MIKWFLILFCGTLLWGQCNPVDSLEQQIQTELFLEWSMNHGFPFAEVEQVENADCPNSPSLLMRRGDAWVWAKAKRLGEGKTKDEVVEGLSLLVPGEPVVLKNLERARKRIRRSGWFEDVGYPQLYFRAPQCV